MARYSMSAEDQIEQGVNCGDIIAAGPLRRDPYHNPHRIVLREIRGADGTKVDKYVVHMQVFVEEDARNFFHSGNYHIVYDGDAHAALEKAWEDFDRRVRFWMGFPAKDKPRPKDPPTIKVGFETRELVLDDIRAAQLDLLRGTLDGPTTKFIDALLSFLCRKLAEDDAA